MNVPDTSENPVDTRTPASEALWSMTRAERVQAMWNRELSFGQLREWSSRRPEEVPTLGGEFAWIAMLTPEWAELEPSA
jgi:hypothetical protein